MPIIPGTFLGRYEVQSLLGAGGMGEVYLAQDTQLRRPVALKFLPANFTQDEDRLRRFEQEAYAASALNHPNILTIYEIGLTDSTRFIAMEYVDGRTLRQHISRAHPASSPDGSLVTGGNMKLGEVLDVAIQVASALAASQSAGIAHRDIKPENIMVRRDGYVKVLDFGLAKLTERQEIATSSEAPTRALVNTSPGAVLGTANYMSPEQARGEMVDARTDVWSLGVVLYEMLTGRMPFEGPTASHVIVSILEKDPAAIARYVTDVPEALEWIVTKALTKDRDDRYQTAREMLTDLRRLKQRLEVGAELERSVAPNTAAGSAQITATSTQTAAPTVNAFPLQPRMTQVDAAHTVSSAEYLVKEITQHKLGFGIALVALVAVIGVGAFVWSKFGVSSAARSFQKIRLSRLTNTGKATVAAMSPDGRYMVHVVSDGAQSSLWVRQVATSSNVQIVQPAESRFIGLTFSPDGNYVYYVVYERNSPMGIVYQLPVLGGNAKKIIEDVDTPITFSADGKRFAFIRQYPQFGETALFVASIDGSGEEKIISRQRPSRFDAGAAVGPAWMPNGEVVACPAGKLEDGADRHTVVAVNLTKKTEQEITSHRWSFVQQNAWAPDGNGLIVNAQEQQGGAFQLWYIAYPAGQVDRITNDLNNYNGVSLSADGSTLVTVEAETSSNVWLAPATNADQATRLTSGKNEGAAGLNWTPDGRIVYTVFNETVGDLFVSDANGGNQKQLTSDASLNGFPSVSPDGRYIVFVSNRTGAPHIWRMDSDGANLKQLTNDVAELSPVISPDGRWIVYQSISNFNLWKVSIDGGTPSRLNDKLASQPAISPDGKLVASRYREEALKPFQLGIISFENGHLVKAIDLPPTANTFNTVQWTADGRAIRYIDTRAGISNIWSQPIDGSAAKQVTNFRTDQIFAFDFSADGKRLAVARGNISSDVVLIADVK